jgi:adenylate kinase family enzyme
MPVREPIRLGRRIVVWGATGSGKTTLARRLGELLGLGVIELDAIRHRYGWDSVELEDMRPVLSQRLESLPDGWVVDGGYHSAVGDLYLHAADTLIWLHLPWRVSFWRLFKRTVTRAWTREPVYYEDGPRESWRLSFLTRRSILLWSISNHRTNVRNARQRIATLPPGVQVHELRSTKEVAAFEAKLGGTIGAPRTLRR